MLVVLPCRLWLMPAACLSQKWIGTACFVRGSKPRPPQCRSSLAALCIQLPHSDARFEILTDIGYGFQLLIRRLHVLVVIALALLSLGICDRLREEAGAVEVDVRVEVIRTEGVDLCGERLRDVRIPQMFPHHRAILGFGQGVVVGVPWTRFGELDAQRLQQQWPPCN